MNEFYLFKFNDKNGYLEYEDIDLMAYNLSHDYKLSIAYEDNKVIYIEYLQVTSSHIFNCM